MLASQNSFPLNGGLSEHEKDEDDEHHLVQHHHHHHHHHHSSVNDHQLGVEEHQQLLGDEHNDLLHHTNDDEDSPNHDGGLAGNVLEGANVLPPIAEVEALGKQIGSRDLASHMYTGMVAPAHPILAPMYTHLPLNPSATMDEMPLYVNAKQYNRILKRRQARAKLEAENIILPRKGYLHPSRHKWAKGRKRGPGGRFLSKEEVQGDDDDDDDDLIKSKPEDNGVGIEHDEQDKKRQKTV